MFGNNKLPSQLKAAFDKAYAAIQARLDIAAARRRLDAQIAAATAAVESARTKLQSELAEAYIAGNPQSECPGHAAVASAEANLRALQSTPSALDARLISGEAAILESTKPFTEEFDEFAQSRLAEFSAELEKACVPLAAVLRRGEALGAALGLRALVEAVHASRIPDPRDSRREMLSLTEATLEHHGWTEHRAWEKDPKAAGLHSEFAPLLKLFQQLEAVNEEIRLRRHKTAQAKLDSEAETRPRTAQTREYPHIAPVSDKAVVVTMGARGLDRMNVDLPVEVGK